MKVHHVILSSSLKCNNNIIVIISSFRLGNSGIRTHFVSIDIIIYYDIHIVKTRARTHTQTFQYNIIFYPHTRDFHRPVIITDVLIQCLPTNWQVDLTDVFPAARDRAALYREPLQRHTRCGIIIIWYHYFIFDIITLSSLLELRQSVPQPRRWRFLSSVLDLMKMDFRLSHTVWVLYFLFPLIRLTSHLNGFTRSKALAHRLRLYTCRNRHFRLLRLASARYIIQPNRRIILCIYGRYTLKTPYHIFL